MGTFRSLTENDVRSLLAGFGVSGYQGHRPIAAGTINTNFAISCDDAARFLRINEGKSQAEVVREAAIVAHVAARGVPTPKVISSVAGAPYVQLGDGAFVSLFPWVPGRTLRRDEVGPKQAHQAGRALAKLHAAGADFPDHRPGRYEPDEIDRRFASIAGSSSDPLVVEAVAILGPELAALRDERRADLPLGLIHGDLFIDNVLYDNAGELTALLDFEQASWGRLAYDVAVSVLAFGFGHEDFRDDVTRAFVDGYAALRAPTEAERAGFAAELRFAACRFAVTRITDVYLRRTPGAPPGKDFRRYLTRLARAKARAHESLFGAFA